MSFSHLAVTIALTLFAGAGLCGRVDIDGYDTGETGAVPPRGACCDGATCAERSAASCESMGGAFAGAETTCDDIDCGLRACCRPGYVDCVLLSADDCAGWVGTSHADSVTCEPNPCGSVEGACCTSSGCLVTTEDICAEYEDSTWLGVDATCDPDPC